MHPPRKIAATGGEKTSRAKAQIRNSILHGCPHKPSTTTSSSSSVDMDAFDGRSSGKIKAFSTCKCWPRQLNWHTGCLIFTPGCWINRICVHRCDRATTVQRRSAWKTLPVALPGNETQHVSLTNRLNRLRAYHSAEWKSPDLLSSPLLHAHCNKEHQHSHTGPFLKSPPETMCTLKPV